MAQNKPAIERRDANADELVSIVKYVGILATEYPVPITYTELAKKAHVTKAAISKVKEKLVSVCDVKMLAYQRKLLLRTDGRTITQIFLAFFMSSKPGPLLRTPYVKILWMNYVQRLFAKASKPFPELASFFSKEDALFASNLILRNVADTLVRAPPIIRGASEDSVRYAIIDLAQRLMERFGPNFARYLRNETTLKQILVLRDKAWFLCLEVIGQYLPQLFYAFLATMPDDQSRQTYLEVYQQTAVYYLEQMVFAYVTNQIRTAALKAKVPYLEEYSTLGRFFKPPQLTDKTNRKRVLGSPVTPTVDRTGNVAGASGPRV